ncbi:MAG TPA: hypothetical protein VL137_11195 [Polyangiaceae bacterium]|nr:hypothetical protein [Polyangiaceae bacterium]
MLNLFVEGGFPMWFLLTFGLATLFFAARFARAPSHRTLKTAFALGGATVFTILTAMCTDLAMVGHHAPEYLKTHPEMSLSEVLLQGLAESLSPGILGFTMLSLAALIVAYGFQRDPLPG